MLDQWQKLEKQVDLLFAGIDTLPDNFSSASVSSNTTCYPLSDGILFGYGFSYIPTHRIIEELKSTTASAGLSSGNGTLPGRRPTS